MPAHNVFLNNTILKQQQKNPFKYDLKSSRQQFIKHPPPPQKKNYPINSLKNIYKFLLRGLERKKI